MLEIREAELVKELAEFIKESTSINNEKYGALNTVIYATISGWLFALVFMVASALCT